MILMLVHITKFIILSLIAVSTVTSIESVAILPTSAQSNSTAGDLSTPQDELQDQNFSLMTLNSKEMEEIRSTVNSTRQAVANGNMTEALIQLTVLDQQLELIAERASPFEE
jgi:hypothetical protein